jgi:outer membrane protein
MIFRVVTNVVLLVMALTGPVQAQDIKIGYVDARRLIDEAPQGKDEIQLLENDYSEKNRELKARIDKFNVDEDELKKNAVVMSSEEVTARTEELRQTQRTLQRDQQIYNEDYTRSRNQGLARLEKLISEVIIQLAQQEKVDLVLQQVVYASPQIDMTDRVLEELKKRYQQQ